MAWYFAPNGELRRGKGQGKEGDDTSVEKVVKEGDSEVALKCRVVTVYGRDVPGQVGQRVS